MINTTEFTKDVANKKMYITRQFDADVALVWSAWTEPAILDQWWAPKPWKAETKSMDFREGGVWLYSMVGPDGSRHYARADYETIVKQQKYSARDSFCDENGVKSTDVPSMFWINKFIPAGASTKVAIEISFSSVEDMEKIVEMGFKEGFTMAHGNLDELLKTL